MRRIDTVSDKQAAHIFVRHVCANVLHGRERYPRCHLIQLTMGRTLARKIALDILPEAIELLANIDTKETHND